jgi:hypothetical protein
MLYLENPLDAYHPYKTTSVLDNVLILECVEPEKQVMRKSKIQSKGSSTGCEVVARGSIFWFYSDRDSV